MNPKDSLTIHGRENMTTESDPDIVYCLNCDAEATHFYYNDKGGESFLCQTCADAFKLGQTYPDTGPHFIEEEEEEEEEDESGNEDVG